MSVEENRPADWIQTTSGKKFWPTDPRPDEVYIGDIAHALSMLCRYGGHCREFYSVAEHSVHLSRTVSPENALWALLHDATEAYLVDLPRPIKNCLPGYRAAEAKIEQAIAVHFALPMPMPAEVKLFDQRILMDERQQNMTRAPSRWTTDTTPLGISCEFWSPRQAEAEFLLTFADLTRNNPAHFERAQIEVIQQ